MIETLLNGKLDAWWEYAFLLIISVYLWLPLIFLIYYITAKILSFFLSIIYFGRLR